MADTKGSALPAMTTPAGNDILIAVDDPGGAPATQKVTFADAWTNYFKMQADGLYLASVTTGDIADDAVTFPKLLDATQKALIGAGGAGAFGEITLGAGLDITAGALDVVTSAAASAVTANTKTTPADDDYFFMLDPDNVSDNLKEYGLTVANLIANKLNGIYVTLTDVNTQFGAAYTLVLTDANDIVEVSNVGANTVTIPTNASVAFPVGTVIGVSQLGPGATTIQADTGVALNGVIPGAATIDGQWKGVSLYKRDTDQWVMQGAHGTVA